MKTINMLLSKKSYKIPRVSRLYLKLRSKFAVSFLLLILIPFTAFMVFAYIQSKAALEKSTYDMIIHSINQIKSPIKNLLDNLNETIVVCVSDYNIKSIIKNNSDNMALLDSGNSEFGNIIMKYQPQELSKDLYGAYIISNNKIIASFDKNMKPAIISNPSTQPWFNEVVKNPSRSLILGTTQRFYQEGTSNTVFSVAMAVDNVSDTQNPAVLLLDFDYNIITDIMNPVNISENVNEERIIIDSNNNIIYSSNLKELTVTLDEKLSGSITKQQIGFLRLNYNGEDKYMAYTRYADLPWTFISLLPVRSILNNLLPGSNPLIIISIILIIAILLLYFIVSSMLLSPINELSAVISDFEKGHFTNKTDLTGYSREHMPAEKLGSASEIDYLINKIYNIRLKQKEAELNSLQNQINPHFLYNTLESIRGAALYHGIHDIAAMSKALSLLFRYSINDTALVTIKEEIQHLENYMSIQNFRYESKFDLIYSIPNDLFNYKILKLTLQPLIENCIKHGLEMKLGKGVIKIEILSLDNNIKIEISDNGLGIPSKKIEELNKALARDEQLVEKSESSDRTSTGIGVRNVNSRIKLYFGEQYGLKFREALIGTTLEITLPAVKEN